MPPLQPVTPFLWFNDQAEAAAAFYCGIFPNSRVVQTVRWGEAGKEHHQRMPGSALTVAFELNGVSFTAMNGGPMYQFTPAVSFVVHCDTQAEIDHYWDALAAGGDPAAQACGWLKDQFGLSWQIVPAKIGEWLADLEAPAAGRVMGCFMGMKKLDLAAMEQAFAG